MEDPVSRRLVLPLTRLEQVAHDRCCTGATHALRRVHRPRETEHLDGHGPLRTLTSSVPMNPEAPVTNAVAVASTAMRPVWSARERVNTDSTRTELVRHPDVRAAAVR